MDNKLVLFIASKPQLVIKGNNNNSSIKILNRVIDKVIESESEREKIWSRIVKEWDNGRACY